MPKLSDMINAFNSIFTEHPGLEQLISSTSRKISFDKASSTTPAKNHLCWLKDRYHNYKYANAKHLKTFYELDKIKYYTDFIGKNDIELIEEFKQRTGKGHTFGKLCVSTDQYIADTLKPARFIELGFKDDAPLYLDVYKTPIMDEKGVFIGSKGDAIDVSYRGNQIIDLLQYYLSIGTAKRLDKAQHKRVASYLISDEIALQNSEEFPI